MNPSRQAFLALGSNIGDRYEHLTRAVDFLSNHTDLTFKSVSPFLETAPVGPPQPDYLNAVVHVETHLSPWPLLKLVKAYEVVAGRRDGARWGPRIIDIDILLLGDVDMAEPGLTIPHKELTVRRFVLEPLAALAADLVPPGQSKSVAKLLEALA